MAFDLASIANSDLDLAPTAENVVVAEQPNNILHDSKGTFSSLEKIPEIKAKIAADEAAAVIPEKKEEPKVEHIPTGISLQKIAETLNEQEGTVETPQGRPKTDKNPIVGYIQQKIEDGEFFTWKDYDETKQPLSDYLKNMPEKELEQLLDLNVKKKMEAGYESAPTELRESLPPKAKYIIDQLEQGGDLESILTHITRAVQVEKLDPTNEAHMPEIARNYLQLKQFGTQDMINAQVQEWSDDGKLEGKVKEFKPLLDQMHEQQIQLQVQQEAENNKQRQAAAQAYVENVGQVLSKYEVGGLKMSKKDASALYYDLTELNYPSMSGKPTNILGHMLEKIQYVEPDFDFLAEIAWHLRDRAGYNNAQATKAKSEKALEFAKELKDAQYIRTQVATPTIEKEPEIKKQYKPRNMFSKA